MKISGKTSLNTILKVAKNQGFAPSPLAVLDLKLSAHAMADTATLFGQTSIIRVRLQYHQRFNNFNNFNNFISSIHYFSIFWATLYLTQRSVNRSNFFLKIEQ